MGFNSTSPRFWQVLFFILVAGYCGYYAPYGINETDGGFLTGLAWQVLNGKTLYADVMYVRPPLPVWLRALELKLLPDTGAMLAERWIFYWKIALYSWLSAQVLTRGVQRWILAVLSFVVSVHCYPAAAWHTVDGILFGVLAIWLWLEKPSVAGAILSGISLAACLLCKQSFYPMALVWAVLVTGSCDIAGTSGARRAAAVGAFSLSLVAFIAYLYSKQLLTGFLNMTTGATSGSQALQHGVIDYFRIQPVVAVLSGLVLLPTGWWWWKKRGERLVYTGWVFWLLVLTGSYVFALHHRQDFTAPFAQTRLLFVVSVAWAVYATWQQLWPRERALRFFALMGVSWCAAISWGYNLPVLFSSPWVFVALEISRTLFKSAFPGKPYSGWGALLFLVLLLGTFRYGYDFIYRDGSRGNMQEPLGEIFPALYGIYSSPETAGLYRELKMLTQQFGPHIKTLPAFPQANYLTQTKPDLPLDWVVEREMYTGKELVIKSLDQNKPVLLIERQYGNTIFFDPQLSLTGDYFRRGRVVRETAFFWVVVL